MVNETMVLRRINRDIGDDIFQSVQLSWIKHIIDDETLYTFSEYYPKAVDNIYIDKSMAIPESDPRSGRTVYWHYKLPNPDQRVFIGIETTFHPMSDQGSPYFYQGAQSPIVSAMAQKLSSAFPGGMTFTARLDGPEVIAKDPSTSQHMDFIVNATAVRRLVEIPKYYRTPFLELAVCDVKLAIYNKHRVLRDEQTLGGTSVDLKISEFGDAAQERKDLLEKFESDYYKDPERIRSVLRYAE